WAATWMPLTLPYAFLPWIIAGFIRIGKAETKKDTAVGQVQTAFMLYCLFFSGAPNPALYGGASIAFCLASSPASGPYNLRRLLVGSIPVAVFFCLVVGPLLWSASEVYRFYGRRVVPESWGLFSVPFQAYVGLFFPNTYALWPVYYDSARLLGNIIVSFGAVPAWFVTVALLKDPGLVLNRTVAPLIIGCAVFVIILSPQEFGLAAAMSEMPLLNAFRFPFRAVPAFVVLFVFLFLRLATLTQAPSSRPYRMCLVILCIGASVISLGHEVQTFHSKGYLQSWFRNGRFFDDRESWSPSTLETLRGPGYLLGLCRSSDLYDRKPRLFFHGNLGALYRVRTLGLYLLAGQCPARLAVGMDPRGRLGAWDPVRELIVRSRTDPAPMPERWDNGIGPRSPLELARKTYISAAVVEKGWAEPSIYFSASSEWRMIEENESAIVFVRR
ncbi:MAG: hypothetical protein V2B18_03755, partial [Pseudomonadota bacterium]